MLPGDLPAAFQELQWVVDNAEESGLVHTARVRQAKIKLELGELDAAKTLASHTPVQGFGSYYAELLADIAVRQGDTDTARSQYQAAIESLTQGQAGYARLLSLKLDRLPELTIDEAVEDSANLEATVEPTEETTSDPEVEPASSDNAATDQ